MSDYTYSSFIGKYIKDHIELKQAIGYKYLDEAAHLKRFDTFILENFSSEAVLSKEIVLKWCEKKEYESQANQNSRASMVRQLCIYMGSVGIKTYIMPKGYYSKEQQYTPHIYTKNELTSFFAETDKCKICNECPYRHLIMPIFFRIIYSCGLRPTEARLLKVRDIDIKRGIITIRESKNDNSRLVPMSDNLIKRCSDYTKAVHQIPEKNEYFFPGLNGKPMTPTNVYHNFRRFLWRAGISHGGRGKGPRIMDFRHTYACNCLKNWVEQGKDLSVYLPILKTYMGHYSFEDTAYYLRLTADVFPIITIKLEGCYANLIPQLEGDNNETY